MAEDEYNPENFSDEQLFDELVKVAGIIGLKRCGLPVSSNGKEEEKLEKLKKVFFERVARNSSSNSNSR